MPPTIVWAPALLVAVAMALPLAYLGLRTLGSWDQLGELLLRWRTAAILVRTVLLVIAVTSLSVAVALPLAWLTVRTDLPLRRAWAVVTILPLVIPSYVAGFLVVSALGPRGMLQGVLEGLFGMERLPEIYGFSGATLTLAFLCYPYVLLSVRGALMRLDPALEEASRSLGEGQWGTYRRITLPLLRPAITSGALLVALYTLSDFGAVAILRYETFTWAIYTQYESAFDRTLASGLSLALAAVALSILVAEGRTRGKAQYYRSTAGVARPWKRVALGRWRWPALAFCGAIILLALALPVAVLLYWVAQGLRAGEPLLFLWKAAGNSAYVSALAAVAAVLAALPLAGMAVRHPGRFSGFLERTAFLGFALPGVVVALALVFFGITFATPIYQTVLLLMFAYVVLYLPPAESAARTSLLQVSPSLEEAARSLGKSPLQVMASVTFPLLRSGLLAGGGMVFLLAMKELPATLILSPAGFTTLATCIWSATSEAFFARAAAPSLLLILVTAFPLIWLVRRGE
jgi:iron(III) transport system permease protein